MNLYLRFFGLLCRLFFVSKGDILAEHKLHYRVMPWDCDINFHLTNSRYLSFMDLGRTYLIGRLKLIRPLVTQRWLPVITASNLNHIRAIKPLKKFTLVTRIVGWDSRYFYCEQRFIVDDKVAAVGLVKGAFLHKGMPLPIEKVLNHLQQQTSSPELPDDIKQWCELTTTIKNTIREAE